MHAAEHDKHNKKMALLNPHNHNLNTLKYTIRVLYRIQKHIYSFRILQHISDHLVQTPKFFFFDIEIQVMCLSFEKNNAMPILV